MSVSSQSAVAAKQAVANAVVAGGSVGTLSIEHLNEYLKLFIGIATFFYFVTMVIINIKRIKQIKKTGDTKFPVNTEK
tara:strand:- start:200 stop:433 length:234 start_codon:yes stop_codon:yes gene_type:complete